MASLPLNRRSDPLPSPSPSDDNPRRRSTAQMSLDKILAIIATCPPPRDLPAPSPDRRSGISGSSPTDRELRSFARIEIDLNLRLGPLPEDPAVEGGFSACSAVGKSEGCPSFPESGEVTTLERSSEGECDPKPDNTDENAAAAAAPAATRVESSSGWEEAEGRGEGGSKPSPIVPRTVEDSGQGRAGGRDEGQLNLLVEAARHVSGGFDDDDDDDVPQPHKSPERNQPPPQIQAESEAAQCCRSKRKPCCCWMVDYYGDFEETAPVVRSKRGRTQMLPSRFRDSVIEPLRRLARHR